MNSSENSTGSTDGTEISERRNMTNKIKNADNDHRFIGKYGFVEADCSDMISDMGGKDNVKTEKNVQCEKKGSNTGQLAAWEVKECLNRLPGCSDAKEHSSLTQSRPKYDVDIPII